MIGSVAGSVAFRFMGAYSASKHALEGLSEALRRELTLYGVDLIVVAPGSIATPIWDKAEAADFSPYDATPYGESARWAQKMAVEQGRAAPPPPRVAQAVLRALTQQRPPALILVVESHFRDWTLPRLLPARWLDALIARKLGLGPRPPEKAAESIQPTAAAQPAAAGATESPRATALRAKRRWRAPFPRSRRSDNGRHA
jgi:short-subunit dehydrogenase